MSSVLMLDAKDDKELKRFVPPLRSFIEEADLVYFTSVNTSCRCVIFQ